MPLGFAPRPACAASCALSHWRRECAAGSRQTNSDARAPDTTTLERVELPSIEDGLPAPGLRFGEPRTMALLACLCCFEHIFAG